MLLPNPFFKSSPQFHINAFHRYPGFIRSALLSHLSPRAPVNLQTRFASSANSALKARKTLSKIPKAPILQEKDISQLIKEKGICRLYQSPRNLTYFTGVWVGGLMCLSCAFVLGQSYYAGATDVPSWAPYVFAAPVLFLAGMGTWFLLKGTNIIRVIEVVPSDAGLRVHAYLQPILPLPFQRGKVIEARPRDVSISSAEPTFDFAPESISSNGRLSRLLEQIFLGSRKVFTNEGFVYVSIADRRGPYKLDMTGDFLSDRRVLRALLAFEFHA